MQISQVEYDTLVKLGLVEACSGKTLAHRDHRIDSPGKIAIVVHGTPLAKPRMTQRDKWAKRPCVVKYRTWCDRIRAAAGEMPPAESVAEVNWTAYFEPPKSWKKKRRWDAIGQPHRSTPDKDNVEKGLLDILFKQDKGIADGRGRKRWGTPARIEISIILE
jgi:Holliday junction resolvase RusA-like endonuclease